MQLHLHHWRSKRPKDASKLRVVAEISGQFSPEEGAPLRGLEDRPDGGYGPARTPLKLDVPATLTTRIEPKDTAQAFSALDRLAKTPGAVVLGGKIELNGGRSETDFIDYTYRTGCRRERRRS